MKKLSVLLISILMITAYSANAQMNYGNHKHSSAKEKGMMQGDGMMQGMMQGNGMMSNGMCPMHGNMNKNMMLMKKFGMMVSHLPDMQQQLSLNDNQVEKLYDLQDEFKKQQIDLQSELRKKQMKLKALFDDMAPASQIKKQMQACADTKINMKVTVYETAGKMRAVLTNDQKEKMKNMFKDGGMMKNMMNNEEGE